MTTGKLLGLDHGLKRIGVAICDATRLVAREVQVINRRSKAEDFALINRIVTEQGAVGIVVGLPTNYEAAPGTYTQADRVRLWAERLQAAVDVPVRLWDEQLTSEDAEALARDLKRKPDQPIDDLAARLILQSYLDALREGMVEDAL